MPGLGIKVHSEERYVRVTPEIEIVSSRHPYLAMVLIIDDIRLCRGEFYQRVAVSVARHPSLN